MDVAPADDHAGLMPAQGATALGRNPLAEVRCRKLNAVNNLAPLPMLIEPMLRQWINRTARRLIRCLHRCSERACVMRRRDPRDRREQVQAAGARLRTFSQ